MLGRLFDPGPRRPRLRRNNRPADALLLQRPPPRTLQLLELETAACGPCPHRNICASQTGRHACPPKPLDQASAPFHPLLGYGLDELRNVGGPHLDHIVARPVRIPPLDPYIPQVRFGEPITSPYRSAYGIRLDQVLLSKTTRGASDVRSACEIPPESALLLLCFTNDHLLERLWDDEAVVRAIASGGWDLITAPSYSLYYGRPRPLHFHSISRSFDMYQALLNGGAAAIPRVAFIDEADADRQADWCSDNPAATLISIDAMTRKQDCDWLEHVELLRRFDERTEQNHQYLINGTGAIPRLTYLYDMLTPTRVAVTDTTWAGPPPGFGDTEHLSGQLLNSEWSRRLAEREYAITVAIEAAQSRVGSTTRDMPAPSTRIRAEGS